VTTIGPYRQEQWRKSIDNYLSRTDVLPFAERRHTDTPGKRAMCANKFDISLGNLINAAQDDEP
jgi:hypothetical protein